MELLYDFPTYLEPHYAQMIKAEKLKPFTVYPLAENKKPGRSCVPRTCASSARAIAWTSTGSSCARTSRPTSCASTWATRCTSTGQRRAGRRHRARLRDSLLEQEHADRARETKSITWTADQVGIRPFYCSNFCSALHQEMQGYIEVHPKGTAVSAVQRPDARQLAAVAQEIGR
jgi:nitrous-oxide reductase